MNQYEENSLPIIIVITQNFDDKNTEIMTGKKIWPISLYNKK